MKSLSKFITEVEGTEVNGFCVLKPEFLQHTEDFLKMLSNNGWTVVQKIKKQIDLDTAQKLYQMHKDKPFYKDLCDYMSSGDALYCLCQKDCKDPCKDMCDIKDKVRKSWGKDDMRNAMHSSDTLANVNRESKLIFENKVMECCCCGCCPQEDDVTCCCGHPLPTKSQADLQLMGLDMFTPETYMQYCEMLRQALAEEFQAWYQYYIVIPYLKGKDGEERELAKLFNEQGADELHHHAGWIMDKLKALDFVPTSLFNGGWTQYIPLKHQSNIYTEETLENIINNCTLEQGAIDTYVRLIEFAKTIGLETDVVELREILKDEQEHLESLQKIMNKYFVGTNK